MGKMKPWVSATVTKKHSSAAALYQIMNPSTYNLRLNKDIHCQRTAYFTLKTHIMAKVPVILHNPNNVSIFLVNSYSIADY